MHLIPESSSHLHILVSVFPSVGLLLVLGFYVASLVTKNEGMKRLCLLAFGLIGILAIPTYLSGEGSMAVLASKPGFSEGAINAHYGWGMAGLALLLLLGLTALIQLWRARGIERLSEDAVHLVLGLAVVSIAFMVVVGELGWEVNHAELGLTAQASTGGPSGSDIPEDQQTPQAWSHVHMILNHFPSVGLVIALAFFIPALLTNNEVMKRSALVLFAICGVLGAPTYVTGAAAMWALSEVPSISNFPAGMDPLINAHRDLALVTLFGLAATGVAAWMELWRYRYLGRFSSRSLYIILGFAIITLALIAETGHRGGQINHPEIRTEPVPTDTAGYLSPALELLINDIIWFVPWQTVHFFGYSLVFGTVMLLVMRVLGFWKSMPFSAIHRILPLGVFGVMMNVFTGMLMLMADTFRYVNEITFVPKMIFLPIGAIAVLYFSLSDRIWNVKAGEDAPITAKWVAALVLVAWVVVIMGGRLLPYV